MSVVSQWIKRKANKTVIGVSIGLATAVLAILVSGFELVERMEYLLINLRIDQKVKRDADTHTDLDKGRAIVKERRVGLSPDIKIVRIDNDSFLKYGQFPWKRSTYAIPLDRFSRGQVTVRVGFDPKGFKPEGPKRTYRVYRATQPIKTPADLSKAVVVAQLPGNPFRVVLKETIDASGEYWYAATSVDADGTENTAIVPGRNATRFGVRVTIREALRGDLAQWLAESRAMLSAAGNGLAAPRTAAPDADTIGVDRLLAELQYPAAIFFDIFFLDYKDPVSDGAFFRSLARNDGVFVDYMTTGAMEQTRYPDQDERMKALQRFALPADRDHPKLPNLYYPSVDLPIPDVIRNVTGAGSAFAHMDLDDQVRSFRLVAQFDTLRYPRRFYPSAMLLLAMRHFDVPPEKVRVELGKAITLRDARVPVRDRQNNIVDIVMRDVVIPVDEVGKLDINYIEKGAFLDDTQQGSFSTFDAASWDELPGKMYLIGVYELAVQSKDKITDFWNTPTGSMFGIEVMANTLNTIVTESFLVRLPSGINALITLLVGLGLGLLLPRFSFLKNGLIVVAFLGIIVAGGFFLYNNNYVVHMVTPILTIVIAFLLVSIYKGFTEENEKKIIKNQFGRYLDKSIVDSLLKNPASLQLGGEERVLTVMFSDIRGFTGISEGMPASELVGFLNEYLGAMSQVVQRNKGTIDKYIGDAIMAFWGAPVPLEDHAYLACLTAVEMLEELEILNASWPPNRQFKIGIGIHAGVMMVGNMGSESKLNYTVIGDNVNTGSRLEGTNKFYHTGIIISEDVYELAEDRLVAREVDLIRVKGKQRPVRIFELLDVVRPV